MKQNKQGSRFVRKTSQYGIVMVKNALRICSQDRFALKWIPDEKYKGSLLQWFAKGIKLIGFKIEYSTEPFYCKDCEKIILIQKIRRTKFS